MCFAFVDGCVCLFNVYVCRVCALLCDVVRIVVVLSFLCDSVCVCFVFVCFIVRCCMVCLCVSCLFCVFVCSYVWVL